MKRNLQQNLQIPSSLSRDVRDSRIASTVSNDAPFISVEVTTSLYVTRQKAGKGIAATLALTARLDNLWTLWAATKWMEQFRNVIYHFNASSP